MRPPRAGPLARGCSAISCLQIDYWYNLFGANVKGLPEEALDGDMVYHTAWQWWLEE